MSPTAPHNIPPEELAQAQAALEMVLHWVVGPLVEQSKAICDRLDGLTQVLNRIADGIERAAPPRPPPAREDG